MLEFKDNDGGLIFKDNDGGLSFSDEDFTLSASNNFTDGVTTFQLTPPGAKSTDDFDSGQISEDDNPISAVDITTDG